MWCGLVDCVVWTGRLCGVDWLTVWCGLVDCVVWTGRLCGVDWLTG